MGWICGTTAPVAPHGGRRLWKGHWIDPESSHRVWVVDDGTFPGVRTCESTDARLAVVGDVWVSDDELRRALLDVRREAWRFLTRWPGSYWVIAQHRGRTVVLSDLAGARPVFHARRQGEAVWATEAKPLAALTGARTDYESILQTMVTPGVGELAPLTTTFRGVRRVPGGHLFTVDGTATSTRPYEPVGQGTAFADGVDRFRDALLGAVEVRVRNAGGLVSADTSGEENTTSLGQLSVRHSPLFDPSIVASLPAAAPFSDLDRSPVTDQPYADAVRWPALRDRYRTAASAGSALHLVGTGRDQLLAAPVTALADLAAKGHHLALWRASVAQARRRNVPAHEVYRAAVLLARTSYSAALTELAEVIASPDRVTPRTISWLAPSGAAAWLTPAARVATSAVIHGLAMRAHDVAIGMSARRIWDEVHTLGPRFTGLAAQATAAGCTLSAPFLDNEVVRAALAVPVHEHLHPHQRTPLLTAALYEALPEEPAERAPGRDETGRAGLACNLGAVRDLLAGSELVAHGLLDARAIGRDVELLAGGAAAGPAGRGAAVDGGLPGRRAALESLVSTELWLSQHRHAAAEDLWETNVGARC